VFLKKLKKMGKKTSRRKGEVGKIAKNKGKMGMGPQFVMSQTLQKRLGGKGGPMIED